MLEQARSRGLAPARRGGWAAALLAAALTLTGGSRTAFAQCAAATPLRFEITGKITRSKLGLTQGLEFRDGKLYESTGRIDGTTQLNIIDLQGQVTTVVELGTKVFGEGLTILNDEIVQLTWQDHQVYAYDLAGKFKRTMTNPRLGWGLSNDGKQLIFSDGEGAIYYADPATFAIGKTVSIKLDKMVGVPGLNELEMVDGKLYGNIFLTRGIVRVDPESGCIEAVADMSNLWSAMSPTERDRVEANPQYVLNGIAYDARSGLFYVTGKRWQNIFVGRFSGPR